MKMSNNGLVELVGHEGVCLSKYKDSVGVWTIAIGATKTEIPDIADWPLDKKITMQEAFSLLRKSVVKYENAINKALSREVSQTQFDALVSWCYNVGTGWANRATVIKKVNGEDSTPSELYTAMMMFKYPPEVTSRRMKEANLLAYGEYSNHGRALLFPVSNKGKPIYSKGTNINVWEYIKNSSDIPIEIPKVEEPKNWLQILKEYFIK